ncbi:MAG: WYL domain-containing transcriptional regulator [Erysipelotrichaceae bacterium]|nr:WYL domain-containing transcriptional regulator [Erysipelotrichaceae bacterium]
MARKQSNDLLVLQILSKYSDERHYLTATDVINLVQSEFGLNIERRTIYTTVDVLKEMGYEIETYAENNKGYLLKKRPVAKEDLDQIVRSLYLDPAVDKKEFSELVYRLYQTQSLYTKNETGKLYADKPSHFLKDSTEDTVTISDAISRHKKISFNYTHYNLDKKLVSNGKTYTLSPFCITASDGLFYVIGLNEATGRVSHYRIDRLVNVKKLDETAKSPDKSFDGRKYTFERITSYGGKIETFKVKCNKYIIDQVVEKFQDNVKLEPYDNLNVMATITTTLDNLVYWCFQYINYTVVMEPPMLKEEIKKTLFRATNMYID